MKKETRVSDVCLCSELVSGVFSSYFTVRRPVGGDPEFAHDFTLLTTYSSSHLKCFFMDIHSTVENK